MTTILIKKKDTAGAPAAGDLTNAAGGTEIAVNTATKRIYTKDGGGNVVELGTNPSVITNNLLFSPDNTYDIGASGTSRPRSMFLGTNITVGSLTSTRVPYASTGGLLVDSANLTFNGTDLTVSGAVNAGSVNATTLDLTNLEVTNIKAKDGTASITLADSTGVASFTANPVLSGGTANGVAYANGSKVLTTGSALTFDGTNLGIGTSSPANKLDVAGDGLFTKATYASVGVNSGTVQTQFAANAGAGLDIRVVSNHVINFFTNNTERMRIDTAGNLGIGTTPTNAGAGYKFVTTLGSTAGYYQAYGAGSTDARLLAENGYGGTGMFSNHPFLFYINASERMRIDTAGNVGIGTSSPGQRLDVGTGNIAFGANLFSGTGVSTGDVAFEVGGNRTGSGNVYIDLHAVNGSDFQSRLLRAGGANGSLQIVNTGTGDLRLQQAGAAPLIFDTSASERMRIDSAGNVGIGTSSPSERLRVVGTSGTAQFGAGTAGNAVFINAFDSDTIYMTASASNANAFGFGSASNIPLFFMTNNTERMRLNASGNLGIGTSAPAVKLDVQDTANQLRVSTGAANSYYGLDAGVGYCVFKDFTDSSESIELNNSGLIRFTTASTERARIDASGNLIQSAPTTPPSLATNGQMVFNLTSNTNLRVSVRGSDGVTRTANITLA
jgi:hypothetical protein